MRIIQSLLCAILLLPCSVPLSAQAIADPTTWSYEVKKTGANEYNLIFHVSLTDGWHIFSQTPGDEFLIPPSFNFEKNSNIKLIGKVAEHGKLKTERMEGIDNPINYYEGKADFTQKIQAKGKGKVTGELEYQVCNDRMCLPPKTKNFEFVISD